MSIFKTTRLMALAALAAFPLSGVAGDDFGLWTEISAEKKLTQQFSIDAGIDFRAEQQLKSISRWAGSLVYAFFLSPIISHIQRMGLTLSLTLIWMGAWLVVSAKSAWAVTTPRNSGT